MTPLLWFRFRAERCTWRVYLMADLLSEQGYVGQTDYGAKQIFLDASLSRRELVKTLLHEMAHAALVWQCHMKVREHHRALTKAAEALSPVLSSLGFKPPRLPRGYSALRKEARNACRRSR